ncbi:MAG: pilus assembly protein [Planctomycetaceae bacterium]|nr:pilus assembly protein [Planctomycetaceae bacterium]
MHRDILMACLPCLIALAIGCASLVVLCRVSRAGCNWRRLFELHRCQRGGVQSLAFVLTVPVFLMILLFIVQVSQLMVAQMIVHYAAFAGARAAAVWIPAALDDHSDGTELTDLVEIENRILAYPTIQQDGTMLVTCEPDSASQKLRTIRLAVLQAAMGMCPSRDLGLSPRSSEVQAAITAQQHVYQTLDPRSASNGRIPARIANKLAYADWNTEVYLEWRDAQHSSGRDPQNGRAYNVRPEPGFDPTCTINPFGAVIPPSPQQLQMHFRENEVGWQDPLTVRVIHRFALLPGPGRFLAQRLVRADGVPDTVSQRITSDFTGQNYAVVLAAAATFTNEGIKSVVPMLERQ